MKFMTDSAASAILGMPEMLKRRQVRATRGFCFDCAWAESIIHFFGREIAAHSLTFPASILLEGTWYNGFVNVDREGHMAIRLKHGD